ncbi:MAG: FHA domain-containing protein [Phycisphaerales bacterium]|nr:FHA domain-containing protein [Phycisphaerales bacterium]
MRASLVMFTPDGHRRDFEIKTGRRYVIGRKDTCDLRIPLTSVSREHAAVYYDDEDEEFVVEDLGSSNGTFVNAEQVTTMGLCPGDVILIGPVPLQVVINGQPEKLKPLAILKPEEEDASAESPKTGPVNAPRQPKPAAKSAKSAEADSIDLNEETPGAPSDIDMPDESDSFFALDIEEDEK